MNKILVEVYLPAALKAFDVRIPADMPFSQTISLVADALTQLSGYFYQADGSAILCDRQSGKILNVNMTAWELGLKNGSKLMLI